MSEGGKIERIHLKDFAAFRELDMEFWPGINVIIGENATGKTQLLKLLYYFCTAEPTPDMSAMKHISQYFYSTYQKAWNLINRDSVTKTAYYDISTTNGLTKGDYSDEGKREVGYATGATVHSDLRNTINGVFIPAKDIISHYRWFVPTWKSREIYFEKQYVDLLDKTGLGPLKTKHRIAKEVCSSIEIIIGGSIIEIDDVFHIKVEDDFLLEMTFAAEGWRKLALLWLLLDRGVISENSILYWDEPEANLNPKLIKEVIRIMLMLERMGVQIFFTTHDYVTLKWLDLLATEENNVRYHALFRDGEGVIRTESSSELTGLQQNAILDVYEELYNTELEQTIDRIDDD
jgi:AAA15 family ATPase/GTPase